MIYAFNRRRVVDQIIYVEADSLQHATQMARTGAVKEAGDDEIVKVTLRRLPNPAKAIEAQRAETSSGSVHESADPEGFAQKGPA